MRTMDDSFNVCESARRETLKTLETIVYRIRVEKDEKVIQGLKADLEGVTSQLQVVAPHKSAEGFSDSNLWYYTQRFYPNRVGYQKEKIAELKEGDKRLLGQIERLAAQHGMSRKDLDNTKPMQMHRANMSRIRGAEGYVETILRVIEVLEEEINRRTEEKATIQAELDRIAEKAKAEQEKLARRMRPTAKKRPPRREARHEKKLTSFEELMAETRKTGQYAHEIVLRKDNLIEKFGEEVYKAVRRDGSYIFEDGRKVEARRAGAVTRYYELS